MNVTVVEGDLLDQPVDVIVNPWNRNVIPWWLLLPQGVSGAIKRRGGTAPFRELRQFGLIPLGGAVRTSAGRLPFKGIIHVAGINLLWRASERSIRNSVRNAVKIAVEHGDRSQATIENAPRSSAGVTTDPTTKRAPRGGGARTQRLHGGAGLAVRAWGCPLRGVDKEYRPR